ncbi:ParA family protein [Streptomyces sp. A7024]|uniref:ParA family protein n=1 Tax=Streptomyces coryli TaxID=1128680 RepID=A0A6G4TW04_9ACTN|nr:ParA family protein [Streptomyces coryli]NGN63181.1 ParA family protein [Streptomyces coryli]
MSGKGGVGKSLLAFNLAAVCADVRGYQPNGKPYVALASADPQGTSLWRANRIADCPFDQLDISEEAGNLHQLKKLSYAHIFVDTPGWTPPTPEQFEKNNDPFQRVMYGPLLRELLEVSDDVIVPMFPEKDCYEPTWQTIKWAVEPAKVPYQVVINNWNPMESKSYVTGTRMWCDNHQFPTANTVIRRYRVHTNANNVVTRYEPSGGAAKAREDFYRLALEHGLKGADDRLKQLIEAEGAAV